MIFLPYLSGELQPINDGYARGVFFGLSMSTGKSELVRVGAGRRGVCHRPQPGDRRSAERARLRKSAPPAARRAARCGARSSPTSATGRSPYSLDEGGAPLGNALLAGAGVGLIDDIAAIAEAHGLRQAALSNRTRTATTSTGGCLPSTNSFTHN